MQERLPLDQRLETAANLIQRARIFFDIWFFYEGAETRPAILDTMNEYPEFFRFDPTCAFRLALIVHMAALFEKTRRHDQLPSTDDKKQRPSVRFQSR